MAPLSHVKLLGNPALIDLYYVYPRVGDTHVFVLVLLSANHELIGSFYITHAEWKGMTNAKGA